jgi:hypothetical protein
MGEGNARKAYASVFRALRLSKQFFQFSININAL